MIDLEMNRLLDVCIQEYLKINPIIEIKGDFDKLPIYLKNKNIKQVNEFSYDSLKIRANDWAILPYETETNKYIAGWIKDDFVQANNVPVAIAIWFKIPQLSHGNNNNQYPNYYLSEKEQLDPMIAVERGNYD